MLKNSDSDFSLFFSNTFSDLAFNMSTTHESVGTLCKRCEQEVSVVYSRNDAFCRGCFVRFIRGKQRKQMSDDRFKVKFSEKATQTRVVFDFRLDEYDSLVLFDILIEWLKEQRSMGPRSRVGFLLEVVIIDSSRLSKAKDVIEKLKVKYSAELLVALSVSFVVINPDAFCSANSDMINLTQDGGVKITINGGSQSTYWKLLDQVDDQSTREDLRSLIHEELLRRFAKDSIIVKSDSMATLAINILSLTIQGRGSEIATTLTDGPSLFHPLRDVLHSELRVYAQLESLDTILPVVKREVVKPEAKSAKCKTIHELVSEYFQSIELEYPEVISTVEKIGSKLSSPCGDEKHLCPVCNKPMHDDAKQWLEQITVAGFAPVETEEDLLNLERYNASVSASQKTHASQKEGIDSRLCYGCLVTLGASGTTSLNWPRQSSVSEILDEFILTDTED